MIDETEIAEFSGPFKVAQDLTQPKVIQWSSSPEQDVLEAEHYAYTRLADPVTHNRKFVFNKATHFFNIVDTISGNGIHTATLSLHFAPDIRVEQKEKNIVHIIGAKNSLAIESSHELKIMPCEISESYGVRTSSILACCVVRTNCPIVIETKISLISQ
jgi:hypothetical protein